MNSYLILDLETNTLEKYKRKANFMYNDIIALGYKACDLPLAKAWYTRDVSLSEKDLKNLLDNYNIIVGHNIKFDLLYLWKYEALHDWFKEGGTIWDTQLAEYILTGQQTKFSSLRALATEKYGCPARDKLMEPYWEQGTDTKDIPEELVIKDVKNDVLDTETIYTQQRKTSEDLNMFKLIEFQMDGLLATAEMEYNGLFVDNNVLEKNRLELIEELQKDKANLMELVNKYWRAM